jgi:hypothetical protein
MLWKRQADKVVERLAAHGRDIAHIHGQAFAAQQIRACAVEAEVDRFVQHVNGGEQAAAPACAENSRVIADGPHYVRPPAGAGGGNQIDQAEFTD